MTKDEILSMAKQAGFNWPEIQSTTIEQRLERFAALVAEKVQEECAKQLDALGNDHCAAAIRARGQK